MYAVLARGERGRHDRAPPAARGGAVRRLNAQRGVLPLDGMESAMESARWNTSYNRLNESTLYQTTTEANMEAIVPNDGKRSGTENAASAGEQNGERNR